MNLSVWNDQDRGRLFDDIPTGIAVIDRSLTVVDHNRAFGSVFGASSGRPCFETFKGRSEPCESCPIESTFSDGKLRVSEQCGVGSEDREVDFLVQVTPIAANGSDPEYVAAITTDLTATKRLQREYQTLFEKVPCFVAVINRDHRVVKANDSFRRVFGEPTGEKCFKLYKKRHDPCPECPVDKTFSDGESHVSRQMGVSRRGKATPYVVFTAPLKRGDGEVTHVIEMALDMTKTHDLEDQLSRANVMRHALVENSLDAIVVFDTKQRIVFANPAAEILWGYSREALIGRTAPPGMIGKDVREVVAGRKGNRLLPQTSVVTRGGEKVPVRLAAVTLDLNGDRMGGSVIAQDLREVKRLEREMMNAERLAAVGQTVAGLAHGIKNILTGLEGGMYVTSSGLKRGDQGRIRQGWEMLERNIGRISDLAKNLLAFSRGDSLQCRAVDIAGVAREVVELYRDSAAQHGIVLEADIGESPANAYIDPEGIHSCIANLISNAVDACLVSDNMECSITVRLREVDEVICIEVADSGCGMDYEVKQKVFTSFFTTKGKGGSGLGLLLTRKIVQQHGGSIRLDTESGEGTTFRIELPRARLPKPEDEEEMSDG